MLPKTQSPVKTHLIRRKIKAGGIIIDSRKTIIDNIDNKTRFQKDSKIRYN